MWGVNDPSQAASLNIHHSTQTHLHMVELQAVSACICLVYVTRARGARDREKIEFFFRGRDPSHSLAVCGRLKTGGGGLKLSSARFMG